MSQPVVSFQPRVSLLKYSHSTFASFILSTQQQQKWVWMSNSWMVFPVMWSLQPRTKIPWQLLEDLAATPPPPQQMFFVCVREFIHHATFFLITTAGLTLLRDPMSTNTGREMKWCGEFDDLKGNIVMCWFIKGNINQSTIVFGWVLAHTTYHFLKHFGSSCPLKHWLER